LTLSFSSGTLNKKSGFVAFFDWVGGWFSRRRAMPW